MGYLDFQGAEAPVGDKTTLPMADDPPIGWKTVQAAAAAGGTQVAQSMSSGSDMAV